MTWEDAEVLRRVFVCRWRMPHRASSISGAQKPAVREVPTDDRLAAGVGRRAVDPGEPPHKGRCKALCGA